MSQSSRGAEEVGHGEGAEEVGHGEGAEEVYRTL